MILSVPAMESEPYPTLGPGIVRWMEKNLVFGPGDKRGDPLVLTPFRKMLIYRMYEVYPQDHEFAGRRRFRRCAISVRKGRAKTELVALIAAAELAPNAPVRCVGWDKRGRPVGGPVRDVYIPMVAVTEEQSDELAFGALHAILSLSPIHDQFDIGKERILRKDGSGKAVSLASSPDARDGARTTFGVADETHRWTLARLKSAHRTMLANLPKRKMADPWAIEVTTAPAPGEGSVAEDTMEYARAVADGSRQDADLFFYHEQACQGDETCETHDKPHDLTTQEGLRAAIIEASGADAEWSDIEGIVKFFSDPSADRAYLCRVWLNQLVRASDRAFDVMAFRRRLRPEYKIPHGARIVLGFDGAIKLDSSSLVATEVETGFQEKHGLWEYKGEGWICPEAEVDDAVNESFRLYDVWSFYCDPWWWENWIANWTARFGANKVTGQPRVVAFPTNVRGYKMPTACQAFYAAMQDTPTPLKPVPGEEERVIPPGIEMRLSHNGDQDFERHVGNAYRKYMTLRDAEGEFLWVIQKERPDSPFKIDMAMAAILSWQARLDAIAKGAAKTKTKSKVFVWGGVAA